MNTLHDKLTAILNEQDFCFDLKEMKTVENAIARLRDYERTGLTPDEVKSVKEEYLAICDSDCRGDNSVGIPSCPFFDWPDIDADGKPVPGGCRLQKGDSQ